ncbi:MAG: YidB family protein [Steroidobacteraceae bacterium]
MSADQVHQAFGAGTIQALAAKAGLNPQDLAQKLAQVLPQAIDKLTPGGVVPKA